VLECGAAPNPHRHGRLRKKVFDPRREQSIHVNYRNRDSPERDATTPQVRRGKHRTSETVLSGRAATPASCLLPCQPQRPGTASVDLHGVGQAGAHLLKLTGERPANPCGDVASTTLKCAFLEVPWEDVPWEEVPEQAAL